MYEREPLVEPGFIKLPNVVLTPHLGSAAINTRERVADIVVDNIVAVIEGRKPREPGAVNAQDRNVSKSFLLFGTRFAMIEDSAHRTVARNLLRGTGPLRSLRKACASLFASPSTAESG